MKFYTMTIEIPKEHWNAKTPHKKMSKFILNREYDIVALADLEALMNNMSKLTAVDGIGRILCYGKVGYTKPEQHRIFVVKKPIGTQNTKLFKEANLLAINYLLRKGRTK